MGNIKQWKRVGGQEDWVVASRVKSWGTNTKSEGPLLDEGLKEPQNLIISELERILRKHINLYISQMKCRGKGNKITQEYS